MKIYIFMLLLVFANTATSQIKFKGITGIAISDNLTPDSILNQMAIEHAKNNVFKQLQMDSITYQIFHTNPFEQTHRNTVARYQQEEIDNLITVSSSKSTVKKGDGNNLICNVEISGYIEKSKSLKKHLKIDITGLQEEYYNGDLFTFNAKTSENSYIHVFVFDANEGWKIYPLDDEQLEAMSANVMYNYPINGTRVFLEKSNVRNLFEYNTVVFIATINPIEYNGDSTFESVVRWIYSIPYNDRAVKLYNFKIK